MMEIKPDSASPLVSIGVASFNNARYLRKTLDSIKGQDYPNWEVIIVDDCSSDDSVAVAQRWIEDNPALNATLLVNEQNSGPCQVFNRVLAQAHGEYLSIIGSDDLYTPNKTRLQVEAMQRLGPEYGMCYSDIIRIDENDRVYDNGAVVSLVAGNPEGAILKTLLEGNFLPAMGVLVRMDVFRQLGGFDESLSFEDWDMWLRIAHDYQIKYVPGIVAEYRVHSTSAMSKRKRIIVEDCVKILSRYKGISSELDAVIDAKLAHLAQQLYMFDSRQAPQALWQTMRRTPSATSALYWLLATAGIKYERVAGAYRRVKALVKST